MIYASILSKGLRHRADRIKGAGNALTEKKGFRLGIEQRKTVK